MAKKYIYWDTALSRYIADDGPTVGTLSGYYAPVVEMNGGAEPELVYELNEQGSLDLVMEWVEL